MSTEAGQAHAERSFRALLKRHQLRHVMGFIVSWMQLFTVTSPIGDEVVDTSGFTDADLISVLEPAAGPFLAQLAAMAATGGFPNDRSAGERELFEWWGNAEELKERDFYVDFTTTGWRTPADVTTDELAAARRFSTIAIEDARQLGAWIDSMDSSQRERFVMIVLQLVAQISRQPSSNLDEVSRYHSVVSCNRGRSFQAPRLEFTA